MLTITRKITEYLDKQGINRHKLSKIIDYKPGSLYKMIKGEDKFPDHVIEEMAQVFGVCADEIRGWIIADKFSCNVLKHAIAIKKEKPPDSGKLILTSKIDEILQGKKLSRTALSKLANHSQSGLNRVIIGKEPLSKSVLAKLSNAFEISEDEIKSWTVADKYSLKTIQTAYEIKTAQADKIQN